MVGKVVGVRAWFGKTRKKHVESSAFPLNIVRYNCLHGHCCCNCTVTLVFILLKEQVKWRNCLLADTVDKGLKNRRHSI